MKNHHNGIEKNRKEKTLFYHVDFIASLFFPIPPTFYHLCGTLWMTDIFDYLRLAFINYLHINYQKIVDFSKSPNRRAKNNIFSMLPFIFNYSTIIRTPHFYIKHKPASHERLKTELYYTISFQFAKHTNYQMEIQLDSVHWSIKFCLWTIFGDYWLFWLL